ncbi:conjugative transposon protein TraN [Pontibacter qinzhouensis]|uniref:Conjugative transposon protein TraN n=1 Tax=Pontibacter qinzhouensis TaxID=2603253 RepID=A0A5C8J900_9BACT|nr:conjugative transposon protein TraN [Pontibacter qinzhouensis]TXK33751.1 conjugative transposon protein TraN [Pontibacter qinzhouensis]
MKKLFLLLVCCLLLWQQAASAQDYPDTLELTLRKTTTLVFPYAIKSVDRGSRDVLAQLPTAVDNVLQLKAARPEFAETNLTVLTADGRLYSFTLTYAETPATTLLRLPVPVTGDAPVVFTHRALNQQQLQTICSLLATQPKSFYGVKAKAGKVKAVLEGLYVQDNTFFYRVVLSNASPASYDIDFVRFSLRDRRQIKRTATQEAELRPLHTHGLQDSKLEAGERKVLVFALEKAPVTKGKELILELFEAKGGRHLRLNIRGRDILQAYPLLL